MQLIRTILIIVAVYYGAKFLMRILGPILMKYAANKMEQKVKEQFGKHQAPQEKETPKEPIHKMKSTKKVGEYIDFEEIE
ncbi:MAG: DUF4834 domain-containing protein [Flavobacteriaceae bacterium]|nr:DUF4834 domain-containing protein [Flavobacteriaceae bacterium]